jgi:hypothetical protein
MMAMVFAVGALAGIVLVVAIAAITTAGSSDAASVARRAAGIAVRDLLSEQSEPAAVSARVSSQRAFSSEGASSTEASLREASCSASFASASVPLAPDGSA